MKVQSKWQTGVYEISHRTLVEREVESAGFCARGELESLRAQTAKLTELVGRLYEQHAQQNRMTGHAFLDLIGNGDLEAAE